MLNLKLIDRIFRLEDEQFVCILKNWPTGMVCSWEFFLEQPVAHPAANRGKGEAGTTLAIAPEFAEENLSMELLTKRGSFW